MQVAAGVHRLTLGVANWYMVEEGGKLTVVDAGTRSDWKVLLDTLARDGHSLQSIETVLLTHAHADHTGFAERARHEAGAVVRVHEADAETARTGKRGSTDGGILKYLRHAEAYRTLFGLIRTGGVSVAPIREVSAFRAGEPLDVPGRPRVVHAPGHTPGCAGLLFESLSLICTGDTLVTRNPLTGRLGPQIMPAAFNADTEQALRSLDYLDDVSAEVVLPGHGEPWREGLADAIKRARNAGRS